LQRDARSDGGDSVAVKAGCPAVPRCRRDPAGESLGDVILNEGDIVAAALPDIVPGVEQTNACERILTNCLHAGAGDLEAQLSSGAHELIAVGKLPGVRYRDQRNDRHEPDSGEHLNDRKARAATAAVLCGPTHASKGCATVVPVVF